MTIQLKQSNFVKYLLYYLALMLASNYIKTNYLVNSLVSEGVDIALLSGHISSIVSSLFIIILFIIIITICVFIIDIFFNEINTQSIFDAIKSVITVFIILEVVRILSIYFILLDEIKKIDVSENIIEQLNNTDWYLYNSIFQTFLVFYGSIVFGIEIYSKEHKIIPSVIFGLVFLSCFYLININIFDL